MWWPGRLDGPLDGLPLDGVAEAILLGLALPVLWWLQPEYLHRRAVRALTVVILAGKFAASFLAQGGWCVQFDTPKPLVTESRGRIHSWDVRADWQSRTPQCSAIITRAYEDFKRFPAWFFNMPPTDNNLPRPEDRPPLATLDMNVSGVIDVEDPGQLEILIGPSMTATLSVDGQPSGLRAAVGRGLHTVAITSHLTGQYWRFVPTWNGTPMGSRGFVPATLTTPSPLDRRVRGTVSAVTQLAALALLVGWLIEVVRRWPDRQALVFAAAASVVLGWLGAHPAPDFTLPALTTWSLTALLAAIAVRVSPSGASVRGAFILIGIPWLVFVTAVHASHIGRFSLYAGGDDMWMFQRFAYRIYLQGYWLQGGEPTFWFQPFYRWTAGALHMIFGDSSVGEFWWDAICLLASALFAHLVVSAAYGFRWGLAAAVLCLTIVMQGPAWSFIGIGLSDISSAGWIYIGALVLLAARQRGPVPATVAFGAGALASLGFLTRLNNLPMAGAIAVFALPLSLRASAAWSPREWLSSVAWKAVLGVAGAIATVLFLFALRTYHYTGVFSVLHGTTWRNHALWDAGPAAMVSSLMMVLTFNDPPKFAWYALPLLIGAAVAVLSLLRVPRLREVPLPLSLFFVVACSGALAARGVAYAGRFSVHLLGAGCALTVCALASILSARVELTSDREYARSSDRVPA